MKLVIAVIKPFKLEEVRDALVAVGVHGMTASEVKGYGRQKGHTEIYRGAEYAVNFLPKIRIEVAVPSERVGVVMDAIIASAKTGQIGEIYFAGDTELFDGMSEIDDALDVALLPIAGWGPTLGPGHLGPREAAVALTRLRPRVAVPIHWGTLYPLGLRFRRDRVLADPPREFARHAAELAPEVDVRVLAPGEALNLDGRRRS